MRAYPLVAIMLVVLVGCGNAEKEKAEQKAALMREYEFEKSVLSTLEKELGLINDECNRISESISNRIAMKETLEQMKPELRNSIMETIKPNELETDGLKQELKQSTTKAGEQKNKIEQSKQKMIDIEKTIREL